MSDRPENPGEGAAAPDDPGRARPVRLPPPPARAPAGRRTWGSPAPLPPAPYLATPPSDGVFAAPPADGGPAEAVVDGAVPPPSHPRPPLPPVPPPPAARPRSAATPVPPLPPLPPLRHRWVPAADETQVFPMPVLPPVPRAVQETDEDVERREGAPGASGGILRAAGTMAVATLVSRITGLLRTMVLAAALGVGLFADAYNTVNTLPNIVYELLLGGVLTSVIVPLLVHAQERDRDDGVAYAQRLATIALTGLLVMTVLAVLAAPLLTSLLGLDEDPEQYRVANWLARILLVEIVFYGLGAFAQAILNSRGIFGPPAWAPVLNNVVVIATGVAFLVAAGPGALEPGTVAPGLVWLLGIGTVLGIALQAVVLVPLLRKAGVPLRPRWGLRDTGLREAGTLGLWVIGYVAVSQIGVVVALRIANAAQREGGLGSTAFQYASLLFQMPYGIIGVALLTALVPRMSRAAAREDVPGVVQDLSLGTRLSALGLLPVTAVLTVLGPPLGVLAFARGNTSVDEAQAIGTALAVGAFGLLPMAVTLLQLRVFYAMKDARTPTLIQIGMVAVRVPLLVLVPVVVGPELVVAGLMLVTSLTYIAGWIIGDLALRRRFGGLRTRETFGPLARIAAVAVAAGLVGGLVRIVTDDLLGRSTTGSLLQVLIGTVVVGGVALVGLVVARVPELREPLAAVRARLGRR
ncbi:murein biosynthesis integral membrane protein MurJ [Blastococcus sp. VKM Ac-2987]|uniref:murein biosynthesis integral membrane protein MurJ n=1 Tax=Blastococcus sp. VKM Ac-2987 TaxID=3004141 RepID=UPI0022ABA0DA|nr:murein biosynthesis integral membrane protein MurJ [Blastococcus sp. VKM Ac-2987]MCZ2858822.1 murein biosynthesis integral membrane protein MurJ [Blastococcus sp. VKM Ac-2987]